MAGRYQGHHRLWDGNSEHIFEVMSKQTVGSGKPP
jgi:hypothetical protein